MKGAEILIKCLEREGGDVVFGYPYTSEVKATHDLNRRKRREQVARILNSPT